MCEPRVIPSKDPVSTDHVSVSAPNFDPWWIVVVDGEDVLDSPEAWAGTPGRALRYNADGNGIHLCSCRPHYMHDWDPETQQTVELEGPGPFCQLIEYDSVGVRKGTSV